jgi:PAS domain S-box-containing protein
MNRFRWNALTIALAYAFISIVWISFSDQVVELFNLPRDTLTIVQSVKGSGFVLLSAALLYLMIRANNRRLEEKEREVQASEERYRSFVEHSSEGIYLVEFDGPVAVDAPVAEQIEAIYEHGYVSACNDQFAQMYGYERGEQLVGMRLPLFQAQSDEQNVAAFAHFIRCGYRVTGAITHEVDRDGESKVIRNNRIGIVSEGRLVRIWGSQLDVTEQKRVEQALRRSQKMDALGQLTGGVAHDFNNLLSVIVLFADSVKSRVRDDAIALKEVETVLQAAQRGTQMTRRLLDFSRQESQQASPTSVNDVVAGMEDIISITLPRRITYHFRPGEGLWQTLIDPGELEDVLLNLVINARDAIDGDGQLTIETENRKLQGNFARRHPDLRPGDYVVISVSDTGSGIRADIMNQIFEPFFTTKPEGKGTGLGLSMVYGFVQRSRGDIKVYSQEGYGTTFRIFLPRAAGEMAEDGGAGELEALPGGDETVLVVDDEQTMREAAVSTLEELGYRVLSARDAAEALAVLESGEPVHLLFSDIIMPGPMLGPTLAQVALQKRPQLRVLLTSGLTAEQLQMAKARHPLLSTFLTKPYDREELALRVRAALDDDPPENKKRRAPEETPGAESNL